MKNFRVCKFKSCCLHHRRDLLPRSRTERKPAEVVFPARCTKATGRRNLCIGWHRPCKDERMRPTYRRRAESSVVGLGTTVLERNPRRGCGVVAVVLGQSRFVGQYGCMAVPDQLCKTTGAALADRCKGCVPNSLPTTRGVQIAETKAAARDNAVDVLWLKPTSPPQ